MHNYEQDNIARIRPYLPECMVLLKRNGAFPLGGPCRIEAVGAGVRETVKGGSGSGEVNSRHFVNIEQGLEGAGFKLVNKQWQDAHAAYLAKAKTVFKKEIKRKAKEQNVNFLAASMGAVLLQPEYDIALDLTADAAIYVVSRLSGEGNDRLDAKGDFQLTDSEVRDIHALDTAYERFMLVINAGAPVDLTPVAEVGNILVMSQLGVEGGAALADVLLGNSYPSGKLATTWAAYKDYCHLGDFAQRDDTRYREGIYVGYRYFDAAGITPLFPFGFGLGYTDFILEGPQCTCQGSSVTLKAAVTNSDRFAGKEVLQVYVSCPSGTLDREPKALAAFAKTEEIAPGQTQQVEVSFDACNLAAFDPDTACYLLEAGTYVILAGTSSANALPCATFELSQDVVVRQADKLFGETDFDDMAIERDGVPSCEGLPRLHLDFSHLNAGRETSVASVPDLPEVAMLTDEQLAYLNMGAFDPRGGALSVIGNASQSVAGAAGESTSALKDIGIDALVMADGPAGLRLSKEFYVDEKGVHSVGLPIPESLIEMLPIPAQWLLSRKPHLRKGIELQSQYTTALPIATAIAQSFNLEFAQVCGDIVGDEMERFDVDLWLAPALNIHRNVLCGRNFEYYSEDPYLSGMFAAATTRGVQKHPGKGVTIKHYAANNQETNRYANNSIVSERTLREIYLKGFEICVRESKPAAVMTSYNLLNGTHTSEHSGLTDALRREFGFDGVVMTDWIIATDMLTGETKYPAPDPARVAASGCSLFMPGSKKDFSKLLKGLKRGTVTRGKLEENASWLLYTLWGKLGL